MEVARANWSKQPWLTITHSDLEIEKRQSVDEGRDLAHSPAVCAELESLLALPEDELAAPWVQALAGGLLDRMGGLPMADDYAFDEPSDLEGIRASRPAGVALPSVAHQMLSAGQLADKALGAWQGRASGCLLGKPVEGRRSWQIRDYLEAQGRWPLDHYFSNKADPAIAERCNMPIGWDSLFEEGITCMVEDDDTNYTATGLAIVNEYGRCFTPENVASFWLGNIPIFHVCTAERVAYKNLVDCVPPPESASYRNVYREWIGAQIRADFFGYVAPGDPELAADLAWRDASISHTKNGIYGEMWVAAMLAAAYVTDDVATVIRAGLGQVPSRCRLAKGLHRVLEVHASGATYDEAVNDLRTRWNESSPHDWCHTISNAEIVAMALLWGAKDFGKTICLAVMPGFDTDCDGATAGSVLGLMLGAAALPTSWVAPLNDTLLTGVAGYHKVSLTYMASETVRLMAKCQTI